MDELLPVLVARLADGALFPQLVRSALENEVVWLLLEEPPREGTPHAVEIYVPGRTHPLVLVGELAGEATADGFPMLLRPLNDFHMGQLLRMLRSESVSDSLPPPAIQGTSVTMGRLQLPGAERWTPLPRWPSSIPTHPGGSEGSDGAEASPSSSSSRASVIPRAPASTRPGFQKTTEEEGEGDGASLVGRCLGGDKYEILALLVVGGMGKVYRARHRALRKIIAVKVLHGFVQADPRFAERFHAEALAASRLDHPNVVRVLDFGQEPDGLLYIVMEFIAGQDLRTILDAERALKLERTVDIMTQVCAALSAAHDEGIVHRDVKPENILLAAAKDLDGEAIELVKVCDFGVAQVRAPAQESDGGEAPEASPALFEGVGGTPQYMSPEQGRAGAIDARSDVYSCGVVLYEIATGRLPFAAPDYHGLLRKHLTEEPVAPSELDPEIDPLLEAIILRALRKDPADRQQSTRELRLELRSLLEAPVEPATEEDPARPSLQDEPSQSGPPELSDPDSGLADFFVALAAAVVRTGYYERSHPEFHQTLARLTRTTDAALARRGEISFALREGPQSIDFSVLTGIGEVGDLSKLIPGGLVQVYGERFSDVFARRHIVALTIKEGVGEAELADMIELLSGPEISIDQLRAHFAARRMARVSVLFTTEMLGRERKLPWQVDLRMSRLARDLTSLPSLRGASHGKVHKLHTQLVGDVVRALRRPEQVQVLLKNSDLITDRLGQVRELASMNLSEAIVETLSLPRCVNLAELFLAELVEQDGEVRAEEAGGAPPGPRAHASQPPGPQAHASQPPGARVGAPLTLLIDRFLRDRSAGSDAVLGELHRRELLGLEALPADMQLVVLAERAAAALAQDPERVLRALDAVVDVARYAGEVAILQKALRVLARAGEMSALCHLVARLELHADRAEPGDSTRAALAARGLLGLDDPEVLGPIADAFLGGEIEVRDRARTLLLHAGALGVGSLQQARARASAPASRPRFVGVLREIGPPALPALVQALEQLDPAAEQFDAAVAEDLVRALPEVADDRAGAAVTRFLHHASAPLRRAAITALSALWGLRGRTLLLGKLGDPDDGVRIAALAGLRRVDGIDERVVGHVDSILRGLLPAGDELRAGAAAALAGVNADARAAAVQVLNRALQPRKVSVVGVLRGLAAPTESSLVLGAVARSLVAVGGTAGRTAVEKRAAGTGPELRRELLKILGPKTMD